MVWKLTVLFATRPFLRHTVDLETATSIQLEMVEEASPIVKFPAAMDPRPHPSHNPPRLAPPRHAGYVNRDLKPTGSMPTFDKPKPDATATQDEIDAADLEGYSAFLEGELSRMSGRPYEQGTTLEKAWQNGWDRAEHSDDSDDDGV